jgi:hypothetical protein
LRSPLMEFHHHPLNLQNAPDAQGLARRLVSAWYTTSTITVPIPITATTMLDRFTPVTPA